MTKVEIWDGRAFSILTHGPYDASKEGSILFRHPGLFCWATQYEGIPALYAKVRVTQPSRFWRSRETIVLVRVGSTTAAYPFNPKLRLESQVKLHLKEAAHAKF